jgi:ketosteroid isomerase-like protein
MADTDDRVEQWLAKLEIREVIERYMRLNDDRDADHIVELFAPDARLQVGGRAFVGHAEIRALYEGQGPPLPNWTRPGELLKQPASSHLSSNPIIEIDGDTATAETDFLVVRRNAEGRASCWLSGRYRDRFRRTDDGQWLISVRTGVSLARPGDEHTDVEWARALDRLDADAREAFLAP